MTKLKIGKTRYPAVLCQVQGDLELGMFLYACFFFLVLHDLSETFYIVAQLAL